MMNVQSVSIFFLWTCMVHQTAVSVQMFQISNIQFNIHSMKQTSQSYVYCCFILIHIFNNQLRIFRANIFYFSHIYCIHTYSISIYKTFKKSNFLFHEHWIKLFTMLHPATILPDIHLCLWGQIHLSSLQMTQKHG